MTRRGAGRILIWLGVLAWAPYMVLKYYMGREISPLPFLAVHLLGVLPGTYLRHSGKHREEAARN